MLKLKADASEVRLQQALAWLLPVTVFLSAFLLFQVQPLISKFILPWFGGTPAVWTTAMLFFQGVLFGGYSYAHLTTRLTLRQQTLIHLGLLCASALLAWFILPGKALQPSGQENPVLRILWLLSLSVGLPYFTLATTGPLIQAWFARVYPHRSPYRLYSLSNVGSFLALLSFPYLFEPLFELPQLGHFWTAGFWLFALACGLTAIRMLGLSNQSGALPERTVAVDSRDESVGVWQRMGWIGLPALASLALVAVTDHVSHNVAPEPRLWIATLSLYLLTFIITFDHERWYRRGLVAAATLAAIVLLTAQSDLETWLGSDFSFGVTELRWSHLTVMFLICFLCHGELVRLKPKSYRHLTEFYLCMSFGGACGSLFVTLIAVNFFDEYYEWPLCLLLGTLLSTGVFMAALDHRLAGFRTDRRHGLLTAIAGLAACACVFTFEDPFGWRGYRSSEYQRSELYASRNFYGTVTIIDRRHTQDPKENYRTFFSGTIVHGQQFTDPSRLSWPTSYYGADSGVGRTLRYAQSQQPAMRVALVGLGAGTLASYGRAGDQYDFYEINPEVVHIANEFFTYLPACAAKTNIILGDARLKLAAAADDVRYDMIVLDAFSGDSVPVHLLTREAFAVYEKHLKPDGLLVVHITNAYLNLYPIVKRQAEELGLGMHYHYSPADSDRLINATKYVTLTRNADYLSAVSGDRPERYEHEDPPVNEAELGIANPPLWTDHYSSLSTIQW
jgi:hypothetical protein